MPYSRSSLSTWLFSGFFIAAALSMSCGSSLHGSTSRTTLSDPKASFAEKKAYVLAMTLGDSTWKKRWWLEKTARVLRGGQVLGPDDPVDELMRLSEDDVIERFMKDARFGDSVLDFNFYFLGFKNESLKSGNTYLQRSFQMGQAVGAAQAALVDGDYFQLFDFYGPFYFPILMGILPDPNDPSENVLQPSEVRRKRIAVFQNRLAAIIQYAHTEPSPDNKEICARVDVHMQEAFSGLGAIGVPNTFVTRFLRRDPDWYLKIARACIREPLPAAAELVAILEAIQKRDAVFFTEFLKHEAPGYSPMSVAEFRPFNLDSVQLHIPWLEFNDEEVNALQNSSTNLDRRRAAYVLKHFFCDDLNPVGVDADPTAHTGGPHGTDVTCAACHYKLDPMAGFFRTIGLGFRDYAQSPTIVFDDLVAADRASYENNWRAPQGSPRTWNVGYVRSTKDESLNSYGESLQDLSRIARTAPEAKRCLVKRLFEYFVSPNQTIDAGYLDELTRQMNDEAESNSARAFRHTVARIVKSGSFAEGNPDPNQCYDQASNSAPAADRPPCRVAFLLEKNCKRCHDSTSAKGNLDLTRWIVLSTGERTFPHEDTLGAQIGARETMQAISRRLETSDLKLRMPLATEMSSLERQELFLWTQQETR